MPGRLSTGFGAAVVDWLAPATSERVLGWWTRWVGVVLLAYLLVRAPALVAVSDDWQPVGVLRGFAAPPRWVLVVSWSLAVVSAAALSAARVARIAAIVLAAALFFLLTHRSSTGQILWFDVLPMLHVLVLAVGSAIQPRGDFDARVGGWTLRLSALVTVTTYVVAAVAKLRIGGTAWIADGILERHLSFTAMRMDVLGGTPSPLAAPLVDLGLASAPLAIGALAIELVAPLALRSRRWAVGWSAAAWLMHAVIAGTMFVVFHWPLLGAAFVPLVLLQLADQDSPDASRSA